MRSTSGSRQLKAVIIHHTAAPIETLGRLEGLGEAEGALTLADYAGDGGDLRLRYETVADYADPAPGGLFAHPVWLRTYGAGDLVIVEGRRPGVPNVVFGRERGGLVHRGRLFRIDASLIAGLGERLLRQADAGFAVFEDAQIVGPYESSQH